MTLGIVCCDQNQPSQQEYQGKVFFELWGRSFLCHNSLCFTSSKKEALLLGKGLQLPVCKQNLPVVTIMAFAFIPVSGFIKRKEDGRELEEENFHAEMKLENAWKMGSKEHW